MPEFGFRQRALRPASVEERIGDVEQGMTTLNDNIKFVHAELSKNNEVLSRLDQGNARMRERVNTALRPKAGDEWVPKREAVVEMLDLEGVKAFEAQLNGFTDALRMLEKHGTPEAVVNSFDDFYDFYDQGQQGRALAVASSLIPRLEETRQYYIQLIDSHARFNKMLRDSYLKLRDTRELSDEVTADLMDAFSGALREALPKIVKDYSEAVKAKVDVEFAESKKLLEEKTNKAVAAQEVLIAKKVEEALRRVAPPQASASPAALLPDALSTAHKVLSVGQVPQKQEIGGALHSRESQNQRNAELTAWLGETPATCPFECGFSTKKDSDRALNSLILHLRSGAHRLTEEQIQSQVWKVYEALKNKRVEGAV